MIENFVTKNEPTVKKNIVSWFFYSAALRLSRDIWLLPYIFIFRRKFYAEKNLGCWREEKGGSGALSFPLVGKKVFFLFTIQRERAMRPKARGLAQHGGPPGLLEKSDPAGCDFVRDGRAVPPVFSVPYRLPWQELPSCELKEFTAAVV